MNASLEAFKDKISKRKIIGLFVCIIALIPLSVLITLLSPFKGFSIVVGGLCGCLSSILLNKDLDRYKIRLLKQEVQGKVGERYIKSSDVDYLYFENKVPTEVKESVKSNIKKYVFPFNSVIKKRGLKILIIKGGFNDVLNYIFRDLGKTFDINESISGLYIEDVDCIIVNYFGLSVENVVLHEFIHFLVQSSKVNLLSDKDYISSYEKEKDKLFPLVYQDYFKNDISEFTAELGAMLLCGDVEVNKYDSAKMLYSIIAKYKKDEIENKLLH